MSDNTITITRPSIANPIPAAQKIDIPKYPTEVISLPSQGIPYSDTSPLSSGELELKQMTAKEENLLVSQNLLKKNIVLDKLLESLVIDKDIKLDDMLMCDTDAAIFAIRRLAYGDTYDTTIGCSKCGKENEVAIDLSLMKNKEIDFSIFQKGENSIPFTLPNSKINITFKLLTRKDIYNIDKEIEGLKKINKESSTEITTRLIHIITSVDGSSETSKIRKFVNENLLSKDSLELRKYIKKISPALDTTFEFCCEHCDFKRKEETPMGVTFFWPNQ